MVSPGAIEELVSLRPNFGGDLHRVSKYLQSRDDLRSVHRRLIETVHQVQKAKQKKQKKSSGDKKKGQKKK